MKGSLRPYELMHEVVAAGTGLRTERRMSHAFVMEVPNYATPLIITDAAVNIFPTLADKRDICQNAIDLAKVLLRRGKGRNPFSGREHHKEDAFHRGSRGSVQDG